MNQIRTHKCVEPLTVEGNSYLQVYDSVCSHPLHGIQLQVTLEVARIQSGYRQAIAETSL